MSQQELLKRVIAVLSTTGTPYMLTGSWASGLQGEPRSTHDVDLVVEIAARAAAPLATAFPPPEYYLDELSIRDAIAVRGQFNLIDVTSGHKVDFWVLPEDPFNRSRFDRRYVDHIGDLSVFVSRPEDTILSKLQWAELCGGSEKQMSDVRGVYEVQRGTLDLAYIDRWVETLGVAEAWADVRRRADASIQ